MNCKELEEVIDNDGKQIYSFCLKLTENRELAYELYQNTFVKAVELQGKINKATAKNYIIGIAIKLWKNQKRKDFLRSKIAFFTSSDTEKYAQLKDKAMSIEDIYLQKERNQNLVKIISKMDDKYRIPLIMFYTLDMKISEISKIIKVPSGTIKSRLSKAKTIIKEELEKEKERYG
ncbi:MAG: RNA polymerase sigma factor [Sarcina sp.]